MGYFAWYQVNAAVLWLGTVIAIIILLGVVIFFWMRQRELGVRYNRLMGDSASNGLEAMLENHVRRVRGVLDRVETLDQLVRNLQLTQEQQGRELQLALDREVALERLTDGLQRKLERSVQGVGMVRFNPFRDTGGAQSFAIALADDHGDGFVLSSLYRRDATRVYAKPLLGWKSPYPLTEEELEAIGMAHGGHTPA